MPPTEWGGTDDPAEPPGTPGPPPGLGYLQDLEELRAAKAAAGLRVSVCLPARDEEATIAPIVACLSSTLVCAGLVDEVLVIDDGSTDATAAVAAAAGARVVTEASILPSAGPGSGKGNVLWKSLYEASGDVLCWLDADIANFRPEFVTRLLRPLLASPRIMFVKAFYQRPLHGEPFGGGRVTELVARPLLALLFPKLARIVQPLAGEYAGRRQALEVLPFVEGWGVELAMLVDLAARFGDDTIAQADLGVREHRNRPLADLGPQALAVLVTALRRAGIRDDARLPADTAEMLRFGPDFEPAQVTVEVRERPPMVEIAEYRARFGR